MRSLRIFGLAVLASSLLACGSGEGSSTSSGGGGGGAPDAGNDASGEKHALKVKIALKSDEMGAKFFTQNGGTVYVPKADIAGKTYLWATTPAGEPVGNTKPIDFNLGKMGDDLTGEFSTPSNYTDGPWELAFFISVTGGNPTKGPQAGDLAAFSLAPPHSKDEPPITGVSVRMYVEGADAELTMDNDYFIRF